MCAVDLEARGQYWYSNLIPLCRYDKHHHPKQTEEKSFAWFPPPGDDCGKSEQEQEFKLETNEECLMDCPQAHTQPPFLYSPCISA